MKYFFRCIYCHKVTAHHVAKKVEQTLEDMQCDSCGTWCGVVLVVEEEEVSYARSTEGISEHHESGQHAGK